MSNFDIMKGIFNTIDSKEVGQDAYKTVATDKHGNAIQVIKKTYHFAETKGKRNQIEISNPDVIVAVDAINAARTGRDMFGYVICKQMAKLAEMEEELQKMNFDDVGDFGKTMFGYTKNTVNQYIRIGKSFVQDDYSLIPALPSTMRISSMLELLAPLSKVDDEDVNAIVANWYANGVLVDGMSKNDIRKALREATSKLLPDGEEQEAAEPAKQKKEKKSKKDSEESNVIMNGSENIIDQIKAMKPDVAAGAALGSLEALEVLFDTFVGDNERDVWFGSITMLKDIARSIIK